MVTEDFILLKQARGLSLCHMSMDEVRRARMAPANAHIQRSYHYMITMSRRICFYQYASYASSNAADKTAHVQKRYLSIPPTSQVFLHIIHWSRCRSSLICSLAEVLCRDEQTIEALAYRVRVTRSTICGTDGLGSDRLWCW